VCEAGAIVFSGCNDTSLWNYVLNSGLAEFCLSQHVSHFSLVQQRCMLSMRKCTIIISKLVNDTCECNGQQLVFHSDRPPFVYSMISSHAFICDSWYLSKWHSSAMLDLKKSSCMSELSFLFTGTYLDMFCFFFSTVKYHLKTHLFCVAFSSTSEQVSHICPSAFFWLWHYTQCFLPR